MFATILGDSCNQKVCYTTIRICHYFGRFSQSKSMLYYRYNLPLFWENFAIKKYAILQLEFATIFGDFCNQKVCYTTVTMPLFWEIFAKKKYAILLVEFATLLGDFCNQKVCYASSLRPLIPRSVVTGDLS